MTPTIEIKAADVQKLRQMSGAGLMDCKAALQETKGDFEKALQLLREKGIAKSSKRADRVAAEGLVDTWLSENNKEGIIFELNSETDFVARNEEFGSLLKSYLEILKTNPSFSTVDQLPKDKLESLSAKVGEKLSARRFIRFKTEKGLVTSYIHPGSKLGVLVQIDSDQEAGKNEEVKSLGRELAIQVAGANPLYVNRTEVPADVISREKEIAKKQMEGQKKPAEILEKIAVGKLEQFFEANCLLDQPHVRDAAGKTKIKDLVENIGNKNGLKLSVVKFVRFRVGAD
ncbi:MAG: Elongation factor Ts [Elusimicrobia bacterium]|nr:Elongation factor Ts [Elusimicrobiota bacterium]